MSLSERLKYARTRVGLTLQQVKERTGIGTSSLSEYENGQREPSFGQLDRLARLYHQTVGFFFEEGEPRETEVLWRHALPSPQKEEVETRFLDLCRQYRRLEELTGADRLAALPRYSASDPDISLLAHRFRMEMGLGERPALTLLPILEDAAGVKVFHLSLGEARNAISVISPEFGQAVLLNAEDGPRERAFSLAHEVYHLITWGETNTSPEQESRADNFAVHLLLPSEALRSAVRKPIEEKRLSLSDFESLTRQFGVPAGVILRGLCHLVGREVADLHLPLFDDKGEPPPLRPARFVELAIRASRQNDLAIGKLAEYLGISRYEAMKRFLESEEQPLSEAVVSLQ